MLISIEKAEHYLWGGNCDGWHLLKRDDMSVISGTSSREAALK